MLLQALSCSLTSSDRDGAEAFPKRYIQYMDTKTFVK